MNTLTKNAEHPNIRGVENGLGVPTLYVGPEY